jgi:hypothetical protein
MIPTPPTLSTLNALAAQMREKHAALLADTATTGAQKTTALVRFAQLTLGDHDVRPYHTPNLERSLRNGGGDAADLVRDSPRSSKYMPVDAVLRHALEALELDKPAVRDAWKELRARADEELAAFDEEELAAAVAPPANKKRAKAE